MAARAQQSPEEAVLARVRARMAREQAELENGEAELRALQERLTQLRVSLAEGHRVSTYLVEEGGSSKNGATSPAPAIKAVAVPVPAPSQVTGDFSRMEVVEASVAVMQSLEAAGKADEPVGAPLLVKVATERGYKTGARIPGTVFSSALSRELKRGKDARVKKVGRGLWALPHWKIKGEEESSDMEA